MTTIAEIKQHQLNLRACQRCPQMVGPVITGGAVKTKIILIGQAPGDKEGDLGRPFAWTAGKTLFKWFDTLGVEESELRQKVYMAAVCRCFPGKNPKGGDRVPNAGEILACTDWLQSEIELLRPTLLIPVGKLAIGQIMPVNRLSDIIGQQQRLDYLGRTVDVIPLPHPSGASTWHRTEPGKTLLDAALSLISGHPVWRKTFVDRKAKLRD